MHVTVDEASASALTISRATNEARRRLTGWRPRWVGRSVIRYREGSSRPRRECLRAPKGQPAQGKAFGRCNSPVMGMSPAFVAAVTLAPPWRLNVTPEVSVMSLKNVPNAPSLSDWRISFFLKLSTRAAWKSKIQAISDARTSRKHENSRPGRSRSPPRRHRQPGASRALYRRCCS